jgi:protocatechuate 3,4-dioxygenase beta subunit
MFIAALGLAGALLQTPTAIDKAAVAGRVVEQDTQAPIAGAQVMLAVLLEGPPTAPFNMRPMMATTDADGRFTFDGVDPGRYRVSATRAGFASAPLSTPPMELAAGARRDDLVVAMQRGGVIAGRILDASGEPVVDMRVMALRKVQPQADVLTAAAQPQAGTRTFAAGQFVGSVGAQTNDLGEFRVHSLAPGEYYLQALPMTLPVGPSAGAPAGTPIVVPTFFPGTPDAAAAQTLTVTAGQTTGDTVMRMASAAAFEISGTVVDETGQPVAGALVRIAPPREARLMPFGGLPNQARTDDQGTFTLRNVVNGSYTLVATPASAMARGAGTGVGVGAGSGAGIGFSTGAAAATGAGAGTGAATWTSFMAVNGGPGVGTVMMQSADGTAVQYRDDAGTQLPVVVNDASVTGLQLVTRRSAAQ